jgi:hypothetical protein
VIIDAIVSAKCWRSSEGCSESILKKKTEAFESPRKVALGNFNFDFEFGGITQIDLVRYDQNVSSSHGDFKELRWSPSSVEGSMKCIFNHSISSSPTGASS